MTEKAGNNSSIKIGLRSFTLAALILLGLMIVSGVLTKVLPSGSYERFVSGGIEMVKPDSFSYTDKPDYPVWRWFTAPAEVLVSEGNITVITIILFLIFISGSFTILEDGNIIQTFLSLIVRKFRRNKYKLLAVMIFFFMFLAAFLGIYEGMVPLIVFIVPLAHRLGWDSMTGLGMSLLPLAFGFSAAVTNPFTIGVAQTIAELPLFSGAWLRLIFFAVTYIIVLLFVSSYAKKVEKDPLKSLVYTEDGRIKESRTDEDSLEHETTPRMLAAIRCFAACMLSAVLFILVTARMPFLSDLAFPVMALLFFAGGVGAGYIAGMGASVWKAFRKGIINMLPAVLLICMAMSVKHIIDRGMITDTILHSAENLIKNSSRLTAAFSVYAVTLLMNFFIGSASAKAFLMMPILSPLADLADITRQTAVLAFDFGDGFSNMLYPSNPILLIGLGFTTVSYPRWIKWTIGLQAAVFVISLIFMAAAVAIDYGPF